MAETLQEAIGKAAAATQSAEAAAQGAQAAALKAEKAARKINYMVGIGFLLALVGAILAFALKDSDASVLGVSLRPLGGVFFGAGVLLLGWGAIASLRSDGGSGSAGTGGNPVREVGGLIAVVTGVTAVAVLAIVTLTQLKDKSSMVAISSSAFGVISAVIGAYLGIKISSDSNTKSEAAVGEAAVKGHELKISKQEKVAMQEVAEEKGPEVAEAVEAARQQAREEGIAQTAPPPVGGSA
jgi:uncharacterized membrane protein